MKILLLEDDQILSETLYTFLQSEGYIVDTALYVEEAEELTFDNSYDLYLFDINLQDGNGIKFLKDLRFAEDNTPTIFITALEDLESMKDGFSLGALDYIKKPFIPEELIIRIKSKLDRKSLIYKDITYDYSSGIFRQGSSVVTLGYVQEKILLQLLENQNRVILKEELLTFFENSSSVALRVMISRIKDKLGIEITNIRGKGYMIEAV